MITCPKCQGAMEQGFVAADRILTRWIARDECTGLAEDQRQAQDSDFHEPMHEVRLSGTLRQTLISATAAAAITSRPTLMAGAMMCGCPTSSQLSPVHAAAGALEPRKNR